MEYLARQVYKFRNMCNSGGTARNKVVQNDDDRSVQHAHIHAIPTQKGREVITNIDTLAKHSNSEIIRKRIHIKEIPSFLEENTNGDSYVFFYAEELGIVSLFVETDSVSAPSQYLRKTLAQEIHGKSAFWDWKNLTKSEDILLQDRLKSWRTMFLR